MSGGVDSSVAAGLLHEAGYEVVGLTMRLWTEKTDGGPAKKQSCCGVEAIDDARQTCQILGIPYYVLNFEREFGERVVDYFVESYERGETPNPCLACNRHLKFDALLKKADALGFPQVATGHYARIESSGGRFQLRRAVDASKDQSYVLFNLRQADLAKILMPVGVFSKDEIRGHARRLGLPVADKAESQDICFIPDRNYRRFVADRIEARPGEFVDEKGRVLGRHPGVHDFTVGQRRGVGIAAPLPLYVRSIDAEARSVTLAPQGVLGAVGCSLREVSFVGDAPVQLRTAVQLRYRARPAGAEVFVEGDCARVSFQSPQPAVTPGQAAVFYDDDRVIGGGIVDRVEF